MKKFSLLSIPLLLCGMAIAPASAATVFQTTLSGANESPAVMTPATGSATVTLMDDMTTLNVSVTFADLTGPATMGHIHCCIAPGGNAPVVLPFTAFPALASGSYTRNFDLTEMGVLMGITPAALVNGMETGEAYVNLHTAEYPSGEIRGFLATVPEPATWGLMALPLIALVAFRRKFAAVNR